VNTDDLPEAVPHRWGGDGEFVLAPDLAPRFWQFAKMISAAAPSERLKAFNIAAQCFAEELIDPERFPKHEAANRLWRAAEGAGLLLAYSEDLLQQRLADVFASASAANQERRQFDVHDHVHNQQGRSRRPPYEATRI
jgi:hypothetical protein